jgi:hypothetical protein
MQQKGERAKTGWLKINIIFSPSIEGGSLTNL